MMAQANSLGGFVVASADGTAGVEAGKYSVAITCILEPSSKTGEGGEVLIGSEPIELREEVEVLPADNSFSFDISKPSRSRR